MQIKPRWKSCGSCRDTFGKRERRRGERWTAGRVGSIKPRKRYAYSQRVEAALTRSQMAELKETIEKEVKDAHEEYLKLESHIKLYITEMEQSIS